MSYEVDPIYFAREYYSTDYRVNPKDGDSFTLRIGERFMMVTRTAIYEEITVEIQTGDVDLPTTPNTFRRSTSSSINHQPPHTTQKC